MSFAVAAAKRGVQQWPRFGSVQKRFTHRSPSYAYLNLWQKHKVEYSKEVNRPFMLESPQLVAQILRVESAMKQKGFVPFMHAMPASSKVLLEFYKTISPKAQNPFWKCFRSPFDSCLKGLKELRKNIPTEEDRVPRPEFLSTSYALTSEVEPLESAASWGFVNHFGKVQYFPMLDKFQQTIAEWERRNGKKVPATFLDQGRALVRQYNRLSVGNFFCLGVPPEKVAEWMYDSKPYYVPTGCDIGSVVRHPQLFKGGRVANLLLAKEVLTPSSGLIGVCANDAEAEQFCKGVKLVSPHQIPLYKEILAASPTEFEQREMAKRVDLDQKLKALMSDFQEWATSGKEFDSLVDSDFEGGDIPETLP